MATSRVLGPVDRGVTESPLMTPTESLSSSERSLSGMDFFFSAI